MLSADAAFRIGNLVALVAWLALLVSLFLPALRARVWTATGRLVPALLAVAYLLLLVAAWGKAPGGGFGSLTELRALFANDHALAAGWLHYLAFDLFVGSWIARDGLARTVPPLLLVPCLLLTFLAGPIGLLLYLALRLTSRSPQETRS